MNSWDLISTLTAVDQTASLRPFIPSQQVRARLAELYGHPDNVDLWVGSTLERRVEGGRVGPTTQCLLLEQFRRTREGDRFWYEGQQAFTAGQLAQIRLGSLARVICDNGDNIQRVPANVFLNTDTSHFLDCSQVDQPSLNPWTGQCWLTRAWSE